MAHAGGRPTIYTRELAEEICCKIATTSKGVRKLSLENNHWPAPSTIFKWRLENNEFSDLYIKAKQNQVEVFIDEILEISDEVSNDQIENDNGKIVANNEYINRSRLRVDTRKWLSAKLCPRLYGEKMFNETQLNIKQEDALKELE
jgi:hypothetical protein